MVENAPIYDGAGARPGAGPATPVSAAGARTETGASDDYDGDEAGPSDSAGAGGDSATIRECAKLDHSDTDNGKRVIAHFGGDLVVLEQEGIRNTSFSHWSGTHWDMIGGDDAAMRVAQQIGALIGLEADHIAATPVEARAISDGDVAADELEALELRRAEWSDLDKARAKRLQRIADDGAAAREAVSKRKIARRKFAISSKNKARLEAMLACAAAHLTRKPDAFNAEALKFATLSHTILFDVKQIEDPDCPDPAVVRLINNVDVRASEGHDRSDYITQIVPVAYDPAAACPTWLAFLRELLPSAPVRDCVQIVSGLGLLGLPVQYFAFHYGNGANGKSIFLETLTRLMGGLAVGLPAESLTGDNQRSGAQASPDLARLFGKRFLRILELPEGRDLQSELVKKLTGGEKIPVRSLFKSYFEFTPVFIAHMSGNGYPKISDASDGIWRRMLVIHWPVQIPEERRRDFEDVLADFEPEYPGILNWLIEGALRYLRGGFMPPPEVAQATNQYREEMDLSIAFARDCVQAVPPGHDGMPVEWVTARDMYEAFKSYCLANARSPWHETRFGRVMRQRFTREDGRIRRYLNCRLVNVPDRPDPPRSSPRNPEPDDYA